MTQNVIIANYHRIFSIFNVSVNKRPVNWITSVRKKNRLFATSSMELIL